MPTLSALLHQSNEPAILLPPSATGTGSIDTITFSEFSAAIEDFRKQLEGLAILSEQDAVSMSLINSFEFVVAFIATGMHRYVDYANFVISLGGEAAESRFLSMFRLYSFLDA